MATQPKELKNFDVREVSFVKKGANRKRRYMVKSEESANDKLINLIKEAETMPSEKVDELVKGFFKKQMEMPTPPAETDQPIATETEIEVENVNGIPDEAMLALKYCLTMLDMIREYFPENTSINMGTDGLSLGFWKSEETPDDKVEKALEDINTLHIAELETQAAQIKKEYDARFDKIKDLVHINHLEEFKTIAKGETPVDTVPISKEAQDKIEKQEQEIAVLKEELAKKEDTELTTTFITKAEKEFTRLGKAEDVGNVLKKISKSVSQNDFDKLLEIFKFAQGQLETGADITRELGTAQTGTLDKAEQIQKMAEDLKAAKPGMTIEMARVQVRKEHPELIEQ